MKFRHIVAVSSLPGLYELKTSQSTGAIVKSLEDQSNKFISARKHNVTPLESIEIYTTGENVYLFVVLEQLKSVDEEITNLDFKDKEAMLASFSKAVPEYDKERVYPNDIKKILKWYLLLKKNDLLDFTEYFEAMNKNQEEEAPIEVVMEKEAPKEETKEMTTKKTTAKKKKTAPKKED